MADVHVDCRLANVGSMPAMVHSRETTHRWMRGRLEGDSTGWVAERDGRLVGYLVLTGEWLDDLFLAPGETGHGVGAALLDVAKAERPEGFCLWVFESNSGRPALLPAARPGRAGAHRRLQQRGAVARRPDGVAGPRPARATCAT